MFGNDIIPINYELGTELNIKLLFDTHYILYKNNNFVVNLNSINIINFINLSKWLELIKNRNSFSLIILNRFYKLPYNIITTMTDKYNLSDIIDKIIIPYHNTIKKNIILDEMDFRKDLDNSNIDEDFHNNCYANLHEYIDGMNKVDYGLIRTERSYDISTNQHQTLYNYIVYSAYNNTEDEFNRPFKIFFTDLKIANINYVKLTQNTNVEQYLQILISLSQIFFYNFDLYSPISLFHYSDMVAPSIDMILQFISSNNMETIEMNCYKNILLQNENSNYFNPISHHLFITPYLLDSNYTDCIKDIKHIDSLLNVINKIIPGIWYKENELFILKNIDPYKFISICNEMILLYQNNVINNIFKDSNNLIY